MFQGFARMALLTITATKIIDLLLTDVVTGSTQGCHAPPQASPPPPHRCCPLTPHDNSVQTTTSVQYPNAIMTTPQAYPPGGTFLDTLKRSFTDVPMNKEKDNAVSTTEFLEAAESLTTLFDVLGSMAFNPVKTDMLGNVKKVRDRQLAAPGESETLQDLVVNELKTKKHTATEGLVWLVR